MLGSVSEAHVKRVYLHVRLRIRYRTISLKPRSCVGYATTMSEVAKAPKYETQVEPNTVTTLTPNLHLKPKGNQSGVCWGQFSNHMPLGPCFGTCHLALARRFGILTEMLLQM